MGQTLSEPVVEKVREHFGLLEVYVTVLSFENFT